MKEEGQNLEFRSQIVAGSHPDQQQQQTLPFHPSMARERKAPGPVCDCDSQAQFNYGIWGRGLRGPESGSFPAVFLFPRVILLPMYLGGHPSKPLQF